MNLLLSPDTTIGFLGAGQLARMSATAAYQLGIRTAAYSGTYVDSMEPSSNDNKPLQPLELMTPFRYPGTFEDEDRLIRFARTCDVVTLENEFMDGELLGRAERASGTTFYPSPATFRQLESKLLEKDTFRRAGIPVTPYQQVSDIRDLETFAGDHGYPFVLKSSKGGYDGYGNVTVSSPEEHVAAFRSLGGDQGHELIAEAFIPFQKELAVQVARNRTGTVVYPCCETIQENHICQTVIAPAPIAKNLTEEACNLAVAATEAIDGIGLFAFEFFLTDDEKILLNESAPRPHNSGHYTIEGCVTSQFENHIRTILGLNPGSSQMRRPYAVMENLLGRHNRPARVEGAEELWSTSDAHLHIYGKQSSRVGRKMGHITVLGDRLEDVRREAARLADAVVI